LLFFLFSFLNIEGKRVETFFGLFIFLFELMNDDYDITLNFKKAWQKKILRWYEFNKRDLPWRKKTYQNFYKIWISEVMLQQTVVNTVIPYYRKFLKKWPNLKSFYKAELEEILMIWQGLGYYQRAKKLHEAKEFLKINKLVIHSTDLIKIPGLGKYTANSISAILKDEPCAVVDGNVERILSRVFKISRSDKRFKKKIYQIAEKLTPRKNNRYYFQSLMDLANIVCKSKAPNCILCPVKKYCLTNGNIVLEEKKRVKRKSKTGVIFLVRFQNLFLAGISKKKILQGLYQMPISNYFEIKLFSENLSVHKKIISSWKKTHGIHNKYKILDSIEHNFTHFHLKLLVVEIILDKKINLDNYNWMTMNALEKKPLSSLMRKVITKI